MAYDYDYFVMGAGSGGVRSARIASQHGARVGIAEDTHLGGTCVNVGCVPKKLLVYAAHYGHDFVDSAGYGWTVGDTSFDWSRLIENKNAEITRLNGIYQRLLEGAGVTLHNGRARLIDRHTIEVTAKDGATQRVTAETILVAVGGWPMVPDVPGAKEHAITSNEAFYLPEQPKHIVIVGGGYIAVEFAGIFHGMGSKVCQIYRGPMFLRGFDDDIREALAEEMSTQGIELKFRTEVTRIEKAADCLMVHMSDGWHLECDAVMYATGRRPRTIGIGLEEVGVQMDKGGAIKVGDDYRTSVDNIFAIGDVTNRVNLTPVAIAEGHALADTLFGNRPRGVSYDNIATAVFSNPNIGTVGLTEAEARKLGQPLDIYKTRFRPMKAILAGRQEHSTMKLVVDRASQRVLGCHMLGPEAGEIMQSLAIALNCGATKADFDRTIGIHPTAAEEFVTMRTPVPDEEAQAAE